MAMISPELYEEWIGEAAPVGFAAHVDRVVRDLGEALGRLLENGVYTERLHHYSDGVVYPTATPVTACEEWYATETTIELGRQVSMGRIEVTYTGGYAPYGSGTDHDLPAALAVAIASAVHTVSSPPADAPMTPGLSSLSVGGEYSAAAAVGQVWGRDGYPMPASLAAWSHLGGRCLQAAAPYRRVA
jgi:hypothetical protein